MSVKESRVAARYDDYEFVVESPLLRRGLNRVLRLWTRDVNPRRFEKRCRFGKIRWVAEQDARIAVARLGDTGSWYQCPECGSWHVTKRRGAQTEASTASEGGSDG